MAGPAKSKGSALQRLSAPSHRRDPDETDPAAELADADPADVQEERADRTDGRGGPGAAPARASFKLVALAGPKAGAQFPIGGSVITVGRAAENAVSIPDVSVSRRHVKLTRQGDDSFLVEDLGSGNGTTVNNVRITAPTPVRHGDEMFLGDTVLQLVEEGAPLAKRRPTAPQPPSGRTAGHRAPTQAEIAKVAPAAAAKPAKAGKAAKPAGPAAAAARKRLVLVAGSVLGFFVLLGVFAKVRQRSNAVNTPTAPTADQLAARADNEAMDLARQHRWVEAEAKLKPFIGQTSDQTLQAHYQSVKVQADFQRQVEQANAALQAGDFAKAKQLAAAVSQDADVFPQAQQILAKVNDAISQAVDAAREALAAADADRGAQQQADRDKAKKLIEQILAADPENQDALDLQSSLEKKPRHGKERHKKGRHEKKRHHETKTHSAPAARNSAALSVYLSGDVGQAIQIAQQNNDPLLHELNAFAAALEDANTKLQANETAEAIPSLKRALRIDRQIAHGRPSHPGAAVGRKLGQQEYLLGVDCRGDSQLPLQCQHFRAAMAADPSQPLYQRALDKCYAHARDLYLQGYVAKDTDPDTACTEFHIACRALPASDDKHTRACNFFSQLCRSGN